jgi:hypothetical protein
MSEYKNWRDKQKALGRGEVRGVFVKKESHKEIKAHIKHILRLTEKGITHEHISNRLARIDLED